MFATAEKTIDHALEKRRAARLCEWRALCAEEARIAQRKLQLAREFDDERDWEAAGCSSSAAWSRRSRQRLPHRRADQGTANALRELPALDRALGTGALTLDQVAAAAEFATPRPMPSSHASRSARRRVRSGRRAHARAADGRGRPGALRAALAEHDLDARAARARDQRPAAARAGPRLRTGDLGHRQGAARRRQEGRRRRSTGSSPPPTRSSRSPNRRRRRRRRSPHDADRAPQRRRAAVPRRRRADQPRDRRAPRLRRAPPHDQAHGPRPRPLAGRTLRVLRAATRAAQALRHCQYPGCTAARELEAHHLVADEHGGETELANLILLCPRHHKRLHDHHIHDQRHERPRVQRRAGREISVGRPHMDRREERAAE